jgi:hypothetical protein
MSLLCRIASFCSLHIHFFRDYTGLIPNKYAALCCTFTLIAYGDNLVVVRCILEIGNRTHFIRFVCEVNLSFPATNLLEVFVDLS